MTCLGVHVVYGGYRIGADCTGPGGQSWLLSGWERCRTAGEVWVNDRHLAAEQGHGDVCDELLRVSRAPPGRPPGRCCGRGPRRPCGDDGRAAGRWEGSLHGLVAGAARGCDLATLQRMHCLRSQQQAQEQHELQLQQLEEFDAPTSLLACALASPTSDWEAKAQWLLQQGHPPDASCSSLEALAALPDAAERVGWMRREEVAFLGVAPLTLAVAALNLAAARKGHLPLLTALLDCGAEFCYGDVLVAAGQGHTAWLQQLHTRGGRIPHEAIHGAARAAHSELVQWLWGALGLGQRWGRGARGLNAEQRGHFLNCVAASGKWELMA